MTSGPAKRRQWTAEQKLKIIEEARQGGQSVSDVCRRYGISAGQLYDWEAQAKRGALEGLRQGNRKPKEDDQSIQQQQEIGRLREVIAEISAENLALKKGRWP
jgi:transposase